VRISIAVPQLGPNTHEATFVTWLKAVGDEVKEGDALAEIMTDKVNIDVVAPATGVLSELLVEADQVIAPGGVIGAIETKGNP